MVSLRSLKNSVRRLLSAPFTLSTTIDPARNETYELLGVHETGLRADERMMEDPVFRLFEQQHWTLKKFIYTIKGNILLDTTLGWAMADRRVLHFSNTSLAEQMFTPYLPNFLRWVTNRRRAIHHPELIWMPYGRGNYWHFLNDFMGALYLLQDVIAERRPPILIHEGVTQMGFFKEMLSYSTFLSGLNYVTYTNSDWVKCDSFITARTYFGTRESLQDAISLLDKRPPVSTRPLDKIFISRPHTVSRNPSNLAEVEALFKAHGFRIVLFDSLRVSEQADLINSAKVVAALHGAGMVNLAFHEHPTEVTVIEIIPEDYINPCYAFLAEEMGMNYHVVGAGPRNPATQHSYPVSLDKLEQALYRLHVA
ncbi:glycosyltransferase family 61 protein [Hymenobacter rubidus]|uniref:glycosyltransferase family 61 protein n=1 Tax=Hymenobacter rubidus TaxID=1441626 RepID=UPI00191F4017|nr:glycosyltransferase family 61 protein [Hymenobacter rubidus]